LASAEEEDGEEGTRSVIVDGDELRCDLSLGEEDEPPSLLVTAPLSEGEDAVARMAALFVQLGAATEPGLGVIYSPDTIVGVQYLRRGFDGAVPPWLLLAGWGGGSVGGRARIEAAPCRVVEMTLADGTPAWRLDTNGDRAVCAHLGLTPRWPHVPM
jgi:hypothetical protein